MSILYRIELTVSFYWVLSMADGPKILAFSMALFMTIGTELDRNRFESDIGILNGVDNMDQKYRL